MAPSLSKVSTSILVLASAMLPAQAFWRMPCRGRVDFGRIDPLVDYGTKSNHAHTVQGSSGFCETAEFEDLNGADCTSCGVKEDMSAYWTPTVHFEHADGTTELVEQVGGMLSYYLLYGDNPVAFPKGFKMIAGDYTRRAMPKGPADSQEVLSGKAIGFNCLNYAEAPEGSLERHHMPTKEYMDANCKDGIRMELMFPSCWNGKDVDMVDHKSHIKYPSEVMDGTCPEGFETRTVSIFFETIWNTYAFAGKPGRFTLSTGDVTGYGYHGDFMMGWDPDFLASAVKTCTSDSGEIADCPLFTLQSDAEAAKCKAPDHDMLLGDDCEGPRHGLCGINPIGGDYIPDPLPEPTHTHTHTHNATNVPTYSMPSFTPPPYSESASFAAQAATTKAPSAPESMDGISLLSTTTYTSDGAVYEVAIEQTETTVVATETARAGNNRRHLHQHAHAHMHRKYF